MQSAAKSVGRTLFTAPAGPLGSFPPQTLLPGSAMSVGLSSGDIALGAIGTVAYTDGDRVWAFGHPLDAAGRRSLLLQDAYVYGVINNPLATQDAQTYKLAAPGHDLGTLDNDALDAVVGLIGPLPDRTDLRIVSRDANTGKTQEIESFVADESSLGLPTGVSPMSIVGPAALTQATSTILRGSPARESGNMCVRIRLRGLKAPLGFCNRYVGAGTGGGAGQDTTPVTGTQVGMIADFTDALSLIDSFNIKPLHIERTTVTLKLERGLAQAFILDAFAPAHVHPGQRIPVRLLLQRVLGKRERVTFRLRVPHLSAGPHDLVLRGTPADTADDTFTAVVGDALGGSGTVSSSNSELGPRSVADLAKQIDQIHTYDGLRARFGGSGGLPATHAFRDKSLRISGSATVSLDVR